MTPTRRLRLLQSATFAASLAILLAMCRPVFSWLTGSVFNEPREDMAHGWFIPLFTIALFWLKRRELRAAAAAPSPAGVLLMLPGLACFAFGSLGDQVRFSHVGAIWLLWAILYAVWGRALAREAAFAVAFLLFTMPMGFLDIFTVKLRIVTAAVAATLLNGLGIAITRVGTGLHCLAGGGFNLDIADPCSGMRSIFALTALTAGYAYLTQKTMRGKWLLFLCSIPLAMLGNLARIFSIAIVAAAFGQQIATGFYHDYSGYVTFLVAVLAMIAIGDLLHRLLDKPSAPRHADDIQSSSPRANPAPHPFAASAILTAIPVILLASHISILRAPPPYQEGDEFIASSLPVLDGYSAHIPYFCQNEHCLASVECDFGEAPPAKCPRCDGPLDPVSLGEHDLLPADTRIMKCNYYDTLGNGWKVSVVVNGRSRLSIHRPEICLPAQGWSIERGHIENFPLAGGESLAVHCMDVRPRASSSSQRMGHGYFFVNPRQRAASHFRRIFISVRDRALARRVTRWAMVTISADEPLASTERRRDDTAAFLSALFPRVFPKPPAP
ncbi:MAG: exosortase [Kiritimatiellae bacterium]|nr:exosortase [Kiritimatiellia bacterium]